MTGVYTKNGKQRDKEEYTKMAGEIVDNIKRLGFNTVFIQLRPNADSIYPSKLFPASRYACGKYGNEFDYDPFDIFIKLAHQADISVHGWINPLRCMTESEMNDIPKNSQLAIWKENKDGKYIVNVDSRYYLNPAYKEVREYIAKGASEILELYPVDGIHIDDYFYPTTEEYFDALAYAEYLNNNRYLSLEDFRRNNINLLVKELYNTVKENNSNALFGVSPSGNSERNFNTLYADVELWCQKIGYVDYICPQVYFGFEHSTHAFDKICNEFSNMIKNDDVKLIVGMTLGKAASASDGDRDKYAGAGENEWIDNKNILQRSLEYTKEIKNCSGVAFFSYQYFYDPQTNKENKKTADERNSLLPALKVIGD